MAVSGVYMRISKLYLCTSCELCLMLGLSLPQALLAAAPSWRLGLDLPSVMCLHKTPGLSELHICTLCPVKMQYHHQAVDLARQCGCPLPVCSFCYTFVLPDPIT